MVGIIINLVRKKGIVKINSFTDIFYYFDRREIGVWMLLLIPTVTIFILIAKSAPYLSDRYIYPKYGIVIICAIYMLNYSYEMIFKSLRTKRILFIASVSLLILQGYRQAEWPYLYQDEISMISLENAGKYQELPCLFLYEQSWKCQPSFLEAIQYHSIEFIHIDNVADVNNLSLPCVVYIPRGEKETVLLDQLKEQNPNINECQMISEFSSYERGWLLQ